MKKYQVKINNMELEIIQDDDGKFIKPEYVKEQEQFGTTLKPAYEPVIVARKPFKGSLVDNVLEYGVGGINIDECRVGNEHFEQKEGSAKSQGKYGDKVWKEKSYDGRFPANVILTYDETDFDEVCGGMPDTKAKQTKGSDNRKNKGNSMFIDGVHNELNSYNDEGSASRYFYCAKASKKDRDEGLDKFEEQYQLIDDVDEKIINEIKRLLNL